MTFEHNLRKLIFFLVSENWDEQYKNGSNSDDLGLNDDSKMLHEPRKTKKKIKNYLKSMGLIKRKK